MFLNSLLKYIKKKTHSLIIPKPSHQLQWKKKNRNKWPLPLSLKKNWNKPQPRSNSPSFSFSHHSTTTINPIPISLKTDPSTHISFCFFHFPLTLSLSKPKKKKKKTIHSYFFIQPAKEYQHIHYPNTSSSPIYELNLTPRINKTLPFPHLSNIVNPHNKCKVVFCFSFLDSLSATSTNPHTAETQPVSSSGHITTIVNSLHKLQATSGGKEAVMSFSTKTTQELPLISLFSVATSSALLHP